MAPRPFHVAAVCAGIGGLELGIKLAVPHARTVVYVEREVYPAAVLVARMAESRLDQAPVWDDVGTFDAAAWRGRVDCLAAGFPCQPHSIAGARRGVDDERWIWPAIARAVRDAGPPVVFLENVFGILTSGGFGHALADLALLGYDAEWLVLRASDVGAPHQRKRVFVLAVQPAALAVLADAADDGGGGLVVLPVGGAPGGTAAGVSGGAIRAAVADAECRERDGLYERGEPRYLAADVGRGGARATTGVTPWPPGPDDVDGWCAYLDRFPALEPALRRGADGLSGRMDRLRGLGNAVVPQQAARAWRLLRARLLGFADDWTCHD